MKITRVVLSVLLIGTTVWSCKNDKREAKETMAIENQSTVDASMKYMGMEREILDKLVVNEIPEDFPQYREGETREEYRKRGIEWAKKNVDLVKKEYRKKLMNRK